MFRIAQLRRHLTIARAGIPSGGGQAAAQAQAVTDLMNAATHPDEAANIQALGFTRATSLGVALAVAQRAQVTARTHNGGDANLNAFINNLTATSNHGYVRRFRAVWVP